MSGSVSSSSEFPQHPAKNRVDENRVNRVRHRPPTCVTARRNARSSVGGFLRHWTYSSIFLHRLFESSVDRIIRAVGSYAAERLSRLPHVVCRQCKR
jgi:hypothetical protein